LGLIFVAGLASAEGSAAPSPADVAASSPTDISVTVYRAPDRRSGSVDLDALQGFALVSETRTVSLPAGYAVLRFAGVADGIEPASAIVSGLAGGVIEKNREGRLLSPASLMAAAVGQSVTLLRTEVKTGTLTRVAGTIRSDAGGGVVFESAEGVEALRCSGLPETVSFAGVTGLEATPTLSVLVRSSEASTRSVTLSYLARGFDWAADYVATLSADGKSMDLGAWVTLANGNGVGFPAARTQVVAGRVNRENGAVEPIDAGGPILAQCWPRGSTSDSPRLLQLDRMFKANADGSAGIVARMAAPAAMQAVAVTAARNVSEEELGDLKLYRVPDRTTVASRQSKQVRLLDRAAIPVKIVYGADIVVGDTAGSVPASRVLRTTNTTVNGLGLPLPSGRIALFTAHGDDKLLQHESGLRDLAVDEEVEISMGDSPDVRVSASAEVDGMQVDISNARAAQIDFELRLRVPEGGRVVRADHPLATKNGRPIFRLTVPPNDTVTLRYQLQRASG
jgi:hypothetical protein